MACLRRPRRWGLVFGNSDYRLSPGKNSLPDRELLAEGDGFLIVIAITADAFGRAVEHKISHTAPAIACGIVLALALLVFGFTKTETQNHKEEIEAAMTSATVGSPAEQLKHLTEILKRHPYRDDRILDSSLVLLIAGFDRLVLCYHQGRRLIVGLFFSVVDVLAAFAASLAVGSALRDYLRKRSPLNSQPRQQASVLIEMPDGKSVRIEMPAEEAERLSHR